MAYQGTRVASYLVLSLSLGTILVEACSSSTTPTTQGNESGTGSGSGSQVGSGTGSGTSSQVGSGSGSGSNSGSGTGGQCTSSSTGGPNTLVGDCTANDLSFHVAFAGEGQQTSPNPDADGGISAVPASLIVTFFDSDQSSTWQAACGGDDDFYGGNSAPTQGRWFQILVAADTGGTPIGPGTYVGTQTSGYTVEAAIGGPDGAGPTDDNGGQVTVTSLEGGVASGTFSFTFPTLHTSNTTLTGTFGKAVICNGSTL